MRAGGAELFNAAALWLGTSAQWLEFSSLIITHKVFDKLCETDVNLYTV